MLPWIFIALGTVPASLSACGEASDRRSVGGSSGKGSGLGGPSGGGASWPDGGSFQGKEDVVPLKTCSDDERFFKDRIYDQFVATRCIACHHDGGLAAGTRLRFEAEGSNPDAMAHNLEAFRSIARITVDGFPLLLLKPTGLFPTGHGGGPVIPLDSSQYVDLKAFVDRAMGSASCEEAIGAVCRPGVVAASRPVLRRLNRFEYDNTINDLFGLSGESASTWGASLPSEDFVNGFDNNAGALRVTPLFADRLRLAAEDIVSPERLSKTLDCDLTEDLPDDCVQSSIESFGARAFRRPLTAVEKQRYRVLYDMAREQDLAIASWKTVVSAMLQSPNFLYRTEIGSTAADGTVKLDAYEVASELSYFFWSSMPDDALLAAAKSGELSTPAGIEKQARRLLENSERVRATLDHFADRWLELDRLDQAVKDPATYPDWDPSMAKEMRAEILTYFEEAVLSGASLEDLYTSRTSYMSAALRTFYGDVSTITGDPRNGLMPTRLGEGRGGILTLGGILAANSKPTSSSPVHRGKLVRERFLCQSPPPPPAGLNVQLPAIDPNKSNIDRFSQHSNDVKCSFCHQLMDPIGFGFEKFDGVGRRQALDRGFPLNDEGEVNTTRNTNGKFSGPAELGTKLASGDDGQQCYSLQWVRYAFGVSDNVGAQCVADQVMQRFKTSGFNLKDLLVSVALADQVRQRMPDSSPDTPKPDYGKAFPSVYQAGPKAVPPAFSVVESRKDGFNGAYCNEVTVANNTDQTLSTWTAKLPVDGKISSSHSSTYTTEGDVWIFVPVSYNTSIPPNGKVTFGYCTSSS